MPVYRGLSALFEILDGAVAAADLTARTYGPAGRTVAVERPQGLLTTKDGFTVLVEACPSGTPLQAVGGRLLLAAAAAQNATVGDGTTATAILTAEMLREGRRLLGSGWDATSLVREIREAAAVATAAVRAAAEACPDEGRLTDIASASSNDPTVGAVVASAVVGAGEYGHIVVEPGYAADTRVEFTDGAVFPGSADPQDGERVLETPLVVCSRVGLRSVEDIQEILEWGGGSGRPLLVVAPYVEGEALTTVRMNNGVVPAEPARVREGWDADLAALAGATVLDPAAGLDPKKFEPGWFGSAARVVVRPDKLILTPYPDQLGRACVRAQALRERGEAANHEYDGDTLRERAANLTQGLCSLRVGGYTETEVREKRGRVEDALSATRAALHGGVVRGAGAAYVAAAAALPDTAGGRVLRRALTSPVGWLAANAGYEPGLARELALGAGAGWDVHAGRPGFPAVWDPAEVVVGAISHACSAACEILSIGATVVRL